MNREELEKEHAHVKEVLAQENDFINSKEYFEQSDIVKNLHTVKKSALETYLKALSIELWGLDTAKFDLSSLMWAGLLGAAFSPSSLGSSAASSIPAGESKA